MSKKEVTLLLVEDDDAMTMVLPPHLLLSYLIYKCRE